MQVALLEDEPIQMQLLVATLDSLRVTGHEALRCTEFTNGETLRMALRQHSFDLLVLDWYVPRLDGLELLQWLRVHRRLTVPVVMLSGRGSEHDIAQALESGASDYVVKPFKPLELLARIKRLIRPQETALDWIESIGDWRFFHESGTVTCGDHSTQTFSLSASEFGLAIALFRNIERVVSREHLMDARGLSLPDSNTRILDNQIFKLRRRLALESHGLRLQTIYGQGYRLTQHQEDQMGVGRAMD